MSDTTVIVSDAHIRGSDAPEATAFRAFLAAVPELGTHLVINGDLFEFWFGYRRVVPRETFATLAALDRVRRAGVRLTLTGGNHDRWGGPFWADQLGAAFHPDGVRLELAGLQTFVAHGDGLTDRHWGARFLQWLVRRPLTVSLFRWLHPDLALPLVDRLSRRLSGSTRSPDVLTASAAAQRHWARARLEREPELELLVLGHTHQPALERFGRDGWYLNPGAWLDERRYAVIGPDGPRLCRFEA